MKIGVALGGGSARGLAHLGVLKELEENGVIPDIISGTSMGAIIGALYCQGMSVDEILKLLKDMKKSEYLGLVDFSVSKGFIKGDKIVKFLSKHITAKDFKELKIPLKIIATDLVHQEEVVFSKGSVIDAVRASISIPMVFKPIIDKKRILVDGGVLQPVPLKILDESKCDVIIGVDVLTNSPLEYKKNPSLFELGHNSLILTQQRLVKLNIQQIKDAKLFMITPKLDNQSFWKFYETKPFLEAGRKAAMKKMDAIKKACGGKC